MKSKKTLIILIIIFAALLIGGGIAYKVLSDKAAADAAKARETAAVEETASVPAREADASKAPEETPAADSAQETENTGSAQGETAEKSSDKEASEVQREYAKNFDLESIDGIKAELIDFIGKPIIVNFWATWCPPCKAELPHFQEAYEEYGDDVQFLMVALVDGYQETRSMVTEFIDENGYSFPVFMDTTGSSVNAYEIYSIPRTIVINAEGEITADYTGAMNAETLEEIIGKLMQ